jgi:hypothetical protein
MQTLYLAVWPNLTFSIIRAHDEREARLQLDQLGAPGAAKITEYHGPLFLDFQWELDDEVNAEFPSATGHLCGDETIDFYDAVLEFGFPHLHSYYEAVRKREKEPSLSEAEAALELDKDTFPETSSPDVELDDIDDFFGDLFGE